LFGNFKIATNFTTKLILTFAALSLPQINKGSVSYYFYLFGFYILSTIKPIF